MTYRENPKTAGSGILTAIPQTSRCPVNCADCFFQSGRSYLEPLADNLPNMPPVTPATVVRVNDGNDSNVDRERVIEMTAQYQFRFFNTSIPRDLGTFPGPVVLTVNPAGMTDKRAHLIDPLPANLMFVRFRTNTWNLTLCDEVADYYTKRSCPVVLTFMAYSEKQPEMRENDYVYRTRTINPYWAITHGTWIYIMSRYEFNPLVHSCGNKCKNCGNCLREFFATRMRMSNVQSSEGVQLQTV
jgi:hypothetical protein